MLDPEGLLISGYHLPEALCQRVALISSAEFEDAAHAKSRQAVLTSDEGILHQYLDPLGIGHCGRIGCHGHSGS
jgi:hypothetical protein